MSDPLSEPRWLSDEEQQAWRAFIVTCGSLQRQLNSEMRSAHDLSMDDYAVLVMLSEAPDDRLRFHELAQELRVPKAHITYRFQRMADLGLVTRESCPSDARGAFAVLTPLGRRRIEDAAPSHVESVRRLFLDHMSPEQVRALGDAMQSVMDGNHHDLKVTSR